MQRLSLATPIPDALRGAVVALGNFDGFHRGHQAVVGRAVQRAFHERRPAIVATFDPHPVRFFKPDLPPFKLTSLDQREELFAHAGADAMLVFDFGPELATTSAAGFVDLLATRIGAGGIVTGDDFTFGRGREGNVELLASLAADRGIEAETVGAVLAEGERISSGAIREALAAGEVGTATRLLTRPFAIEGVVQDGDKRGRGLGYPTANMALGDYQRPRYGIYAVTARLDAKDGFGGRELPGVASLGVRPTFDPPSELLETYIFDFDEDLYGRTVEVALHHFLRDEIRFDDMAALKRQMDEDSAAARRLLAAA
jgi:riboflavin kinase / FMN adenylyltransferase